MSRGTQDPSGPLRLSPTRLSLSPAGFPNRSARLHGPMMRSYNPGLPVRVARFGLFRVRSPLLAESWLFSFPPGTEMFHFPGFAPPAYVFSRRRREFTPARFPYSDIPGSKLAYSSPGLFAVSHVLLRLLSPRHPPYALSSLIIKLARNQIPSRSRESAIIPGDATGQRPSAHEARRRCRRLPIDLHVFGCQRAGIPLDGSLAEKRNGIPRLGQRPIAMDLVGVAGFEPATSSLSGMRSNQLSYTPGNGGADRSRTDDLLNANQALSQLSYSPGCANSPS